MKANNLQSNQYNQNRNNKLKKILEKENEHLSNERKWNSTNYESYWEHILFIWSEEKYYFFQK